MSELIIQIEAQSKIEIDRQKERKMGTKLERYFKQFINSVLCRFNRKFIFLATPNVYIEKLWCVEVRSTYYTYKSRGRKREGGGGDGYVRRWREKSREKGREGKTNSRSSLHLTIYNKSIGVGSRCVPTQDFLHLQTIPTNAVTW